MTRTPRPGSRGVAEAPPQPPPDATARGPKLGVTYTPVERDVGKARAPISIRYTR